MLCNLSKHNTTYTIQIQTLRRGGGQAPKPPTARLPSHAAYMRSAGNTRVKRSAHRDLHRRRSVRVACVRRRGNGLKPDGGPVVTWLTTTRRSTRSIFRLLVTAVSTALAHTQCEVGRH